MLKILISNDDGYDSPGLEVLFEHIKEVAELFVVAPEINNSGAGCSITTNRPLKVIRHDNGFLSVNGKPADCVHLGIHELTPWKPATTAVFPSLKALCTLEAFISRISEFPGLSSVIIPACPPVNAAAGIPFIVSKCEK